MAPGLLCLVVFLGPGLCRGQLPPEPVAPDSFRVLSWNIYMLPPLAKFTGKRRRATAIGEWLKVQAEKGIVYDMLLLQEAFHGGARKKLLAEIGASYPYRYGPVFRKGCKASSGLWVLARRPFQVVDSIEFRRKAGLDNRLARKGALLIATRWQGRRLQLLNTHMNAGGPVPIRMAQARAIGRLLQRHRQPEAWQLACGDFNTRMRRPAVYAQLLELLEMPGFRPAGPILFTSETMGNDLRRNRRPSHSTIDYIFIRPPRQFGAAHRAPRVQTRTRILRPRRPWGAHRSALSDHNAVEAVLFESAPTPATPPVH